MMTIFFSYSHKDEKLRDRLEMHLSMLKRKNLIKTWYDRKILAGDIFSSVIGEELELADITLFLLSPDFLASSYCYDIESQRAMERHKLGLTRVIPIILRPCDWMEAPFGALQALPKDGKPVVKWTNLDDAFQNIAKGLSLLLKSSNVL